MQMSLARFRILSRTLSFKALLLALAKDQIDALQTERDAIPDQQMSDTESLLEMPLSESMLVDGYRNLGSWCRLWS
jgi:hypothetical protein